MTRKFDVLHFVADNAGLSTFEAIEKAYNMGVSEQEPKWIPVSERLPKENIPVLLTVEGPEFFGKARREVILASYQRLYKDNYSWLTYEDEPSIIIDLPIAWMPLPKPKPYETQESEEI